MATALPLSLAGPLPQKPPQFSCPPRTISKRLAPPSCAVLPPAPLRKNTKAPDSGALVIQKCFFLQYDGPGTPPAITRVLPSFGDLGTGRPRIPSLYRGQGARRAGHRCFWGAWYRQAGNSLFYSSRRRTCRRQRPSTSAPDHSPRKGRAATKLSNNPASAARTRQFTSLSLTFNRPRCALP